MPILKVISGHGSTAGIKKYLEKDGRALARDFLNLPIDEWLSDDNELASIFIDWSKEMDATRELFGTGVAWHGKAARTFKHFVISPDPRDSIGLSDLRELAKSWAERFFPHHEIAIIYHDDNRHGIPHAHLVVNNADLETGRRMHTDHPEDLNRALQDMAKERGLLALSNQLPGKDVDGNYVARTKKRVYIGRAEAEILREKNYSWVADIRSRVSIAKNTSRSEEEFKAALTKLGLRVQDRSENSGCDDWVYSLIDEPTKKVSGERLGYVFGKNVLKNRFERFASYMPSSHDVSLMRKHAIRAVELNDLKDLNSLANSIETCARFNITKGEDFGNRLLTLRKRGQANSAGYRSIEQARDYLIGKDIINNQQQHEIEALPTSMHRHQVDLSQSRQRPQAGQQQKAQRIMTR